MTRSHNLLAAAVAMSITPALMPIAVAQDAGFPMLEEVLVVAQRREQNMQEIPVAVSVVSRASIENRSIVNFTELLEQVPNTAIDQNIASIPNISIRGVSSNTNNIGIESGVGVAVDEVFLGRPSMFSTNLIDLERVEVLRGPQGTLFGKNTIGGLINMVTRKPSMELEGGFDATFGDDSLQQYRGYVSGPIIADTLAGKVSFTLREQDGWVENRNPAAQDLMGSDFWGARGQLMGLFGDGASWLLSAEYSEDDAPENYMDVFSGPLTGFDTDPFDREVETSENDEFSREQYGLSLQVDWNWGGYDFVSVTALRGVEWTGRNDQDYSAVRLFETGRTEEQDQFSQEFRMLGGNDAFNWIVGLYYFQQDQDAEGPLLLDEDLPVIFGIGAFPGYQEAAYTVSALETESIAAFASGTWRIAEQWEITAGLRITSEEKDFEYEQVNETFELFPGFDLNLIGAFYPPVPSLEDDLSDTDWSGDVSATYFISDSMSTYFKVSKGFKAGGFDSTLSSSSDPGSLQFDAETLINYEWGYKSLWMDERVRFNTAVFYSDYQDKQEQFFNGSVFAVNNAAAATIKGVELELTAAITGNFMLGASAGFQDATYDDYEDPITGVDNSNNDLAGVPETTASAFGQYDYEMSSGWSWLARLDFYYVDEVFMRPNNDSNFVADSIKNLNARVGVSSPDDRYAVAVWVKNALDEDWINGKVDNPALASEWISLNAPRMWAVELRMNF